VSSGTGTLVYQNVFANNGTDPTKNNFGLQVGGAGWSTDNVSVYNNTFYHNGYGNGGACMLVRSDATGTTMRNNLCWDNAQDLLNDGGVGTTQDHNLVGINPLFVNAANGDFHLQPSSPALDAGVVIPGLAFQGAAPDIGASEAGVGGPVPTPGPPGPPGPPPPPVQPRPTPRHLRILRR
jgi:hypothetical protein